MTSYVNLPALSSDTNIGRYLDQIRKFPMLEKDEEYIRGEKFTLIASPSKC